MQLCRRAHLRRERVLGAVSTRMVSHGALVDQAIHYPVERVVLR